MNDSLSNLYSHIAPAVEQKIDSASAPTKSAPLPYTAFPADEQEDDDSTIKCVCGFKHDDGSSVFCEKCNTWQHTECYYYIEEEDRVPNKDELEAITHLCTDCEPRHLDVQAAINRQKPRVPEADFDDRRAKKSSKSHKKKAKLPETNGVLTNGWSHDADGILDRPSRSPRDHLPQARKPKTHHRPSNSVTALASSQNPTSHPRKHSSSTLHSPSKTSDNQSPNGSSKGPYSSEFLHLYDDDPGEQPMQTNLLSDINITRDLSLWTHDAEALKEATRGFSHADVFHRMDRPLSDMVGPPPKKVYDEVEGVTANGQRPRWIYLKSDVFTAEKTIIGELKGKIGHMNDYIQDPVNRWDYLRHPAPFVFFHPRLPIYIDTRLEGTICRYLRRSCRPNLIMTTFLENESEYHFCFTAKQDILAGVELTIGWVLDEHMRKFKSIKADMTQDVGVGGEEYITDWVSKVFPEFGGCACGAPEDCWLSSRIKASARVRSSLAKQRQAMTSQALNTKEDTDHEDERSTSGSKSVSRDMTPTGPNGSDFGLGPGMEISDREKRKIAALEKNFEQLENDRHQPATKKKKRNSGGSSVNTPAVGVFVSYQAQLMTQAHADGLKQRPMGHTFISVSQPNTPGLPSRPQYADASTSQRKSGSPTAKSLMVAGRKGNSTSMAFKKGHQFPNPPTNPSPLSRPNYVSIATQTDPDEDDDWFKMATHAVRQRKPYISLTKRLLLRSQHDRQRLSQPRRPGEAFASDEAERSQGITSDLKSQQMQPHDDIDMADAEAALSLDAQPLAESMGAPIRTSTISISRTSIDSKSSPRPSQSMHSFIDQSTSVNGFRPTDLRVLLPSRPPQLFDSSSSTPVTDTPTSAVAQSPYTSTASPYPPFYTSSGGLVQASPAKKKVSLSDYIKRKGSHSTESKPLTDSPELSHGALKPPQPIPHGESFIDGGAIVEPPKKEDLDPVDPATEGAGATLTTHAEPTTKTQA